MRGGDGRVGVPCGVDSGVVRDSGRDMGMSARSGWGSNAPTSGWLERPGGGCHGERRPAAACCPGGVRGAAPAAGRAPKLRPRTAPRAAASPPGVGAWDRPVATGELSNAANGSRLEVLHQFRRRHLRRPLSSLLARVGALAAGLRRAVDAAVPRLHGDLVLTRRVHADGVEAALEADGRIAHRLRRPRVAPRRRWRRPRPELGGRRRGREALWFAGGAERARRSDPSLRTGVRLARRRRRRRRRGRPLRADGRGSRLRRRRR